MAPDHPLVSISLRSPINMDRRPLTPWTSGRLLGVVCDILTQLSDAKQSELRSVIKFISFSRDQVCSAVEDRTTTGQT